MAAPPPQHHHLMGCHHTADLGAETLFHCENFLINRMDAGDADQLNMFVFGTDAVFGLHSSEEACSVHPEHSLYCISCLLSAKLLIVHGYLQ